MAVVTGSDYDHIDISSNGTVTRHKLKDETARASVQTLNAHFPSSGAFNAGGGMASGNYAAAFGNMTTASGASSFAEGEATTASGNYSHAEGNGGRATAEASHAEGSMTNATQINAHAEGFSTTASGTYSHAEGSTSTASGASSHAEGANTTASGAGSHAEGSFTQALGENSHASGEYTTASHRDQTVFGKFNVVDPSSQSAQAAGTYIEIVGNGTSDSSRSNARTLDWNGNETLAGSLTLGKGTANEVTITAAQLQSLLALLN